MVHECSASPLLTRATIAHGVWHNYPMRQKVIKVMPCKVADLTRIGSTMAWAVHSAYGSIWRHAGYPTHPTAAYMGSAVPHPFGATRVGPSIIQR